MPDAASSKCLRIDSVDTTRLFTQAKDQKCSFNASASVTAPQSNGIGIRVPGGSVNISKGDEVALKYFLATRGPISIAFDVASDFRDYKSGVYSSTVCSHDAEHVNHAVLAVGYGTDPSGTPYWLIKNSWDYTWGDSGYLCGNQMSGAPRHRRDVVPVAASARWRSG